MIDKENTLKNIARHHNQIMVVGNKELNERMKGYNPTSFLHGFSYGMELAEKIVSNQPQADKWIPFEQREADDEEKEYWLENYGIEIEYMLCGNLPDDDEEILVSCNGHVMTDTFMRDCGECYLDSGCEIIEEATAWMPLPAPYKKEGAE